MRGRAGFAGEDIDTGHWWIEGGIWFRQWRRWAFGEALGFPVAIEGQQVLWLDGEGHVADMAVLASPDETPRPE